MIRDNDIAETLQAHEREPKSEQSSNFENSQWGGLAPSQHPESVIYVDSNQASGSGMIGNPTVMNSGSSSSSNINEYAQNFFGDNYMYEGYPQHFHGPQMIQQAPFHLVVPHAVMLPYVEADPNNQFPKPFESSLYSGSFDRNDRKDQQYSNPHDILPGAPSPTNHSEQESFNSLPSGGMGGYATSWGYDNASASLPLSMMHSPMRPQSFAISNDSSPPHFLQQGFQFTTQFYNQPSTTEPQQSAFPMGDPSFMMFYPGRMGSQPEDGLQSLESAGISGQSEKKRAQGGAASNRTARTRGQLMVLKDSGDMIPELDDGLNDSQHRSAAPRRYMCSVCSKRFTRPSTLRTHMNSHTGERPYHCPSKGCEWKFTVLSNLKRHMRICSGSRRSGDDIGPPGDEDGDWKS